MSKRKHFIFYSVLGVDKYTDQAKIRKAYLKLSLKYHPDKNPVKEVEAKEQFVKIGEAYQVLSDPIRRSGYDQDLASGRYSHEHSASYDPTDSSTEDEDQRLRPPSKLYETYREAFDVHVAHMTDDELRAATGAAAVFGGILGSLVGSGLTRKVAGKNKLAGALFETAGSLLGSTVGSEAGVGLVQNVNVQSRDRIAYEERKRVAMERGEPIPEPPKRGWSDLRDSVSKTMNSVKDQMEGKNNSQPSTTKGRTF
jgi:DnaJ-domain-containing protein 1